jgi:substrate-binding family protein
MHARAALAIAIAVCALGAAGCGGSDARPFRIGILSDCFGPFGGAHELNLAAAEMPLIELGADPRGSKPSAGIGALDVAGRRVELRVGCVAGNEDVIPEARRLVEEDGVRAIVGPTTPEQGMALRLYARRQPRVAFLIQPTAAPELTLDDPARNVFRFAPDAAQGSAGLGSYAYRQLGWRRAAVVADDAPYAWEESAGFIAEFCALGGDIVKRQWIAFGSDPGAAAARVPRSADGVYLGAAVSPMRRFLERYGAARGGIDGKLVASLALVNDPSVLSAAGGVSSADRRRRHRSRHRPGSPPPSRRRSREFRRRPLSILCRSRSRAACRRWSRRFGVHTARTDACCWRRWRGSRSTRPWGRFASTATGRRSSPTTSRRSPRQAARPRSSRCRLSLTSSRHSAATSHSAARRRARRHRPA